MKELWAAVWCGKELLIMCLASAILFAFAIIGMVSVLMWIAE